MIVSMHHRRRGIGSLLIAAVLAHSKTHSPPLLTLDLEATEFQPGARVLYERTGYVHVSERIMWLSSWVPLPVRLLRFERKVEKA
ncbi:hypothetical protein C8J57DRAFT_1194198 [Mycena rebaudengoi]|nr:hypothetical protein C8J57DRAFT_1194198 [Mycena rebaudengoi]